MSLVSWPQLGICLETVRRFACHVHENLNSGYDRTQRVLLVHNLWVNGQRSFWKKSDNLHSSLVWSVCNLLVGFIQLQELCCSIMLTTKLNGKSWCHLGSVSGEFLDIISHNPSVSKSNRLHVVIFWFSSLVWGIFYRFPKWLVFFLKSWFSTGYFSNSTDSSVTDGRFSP